MNNLIKSRLESLSQYFELRDVRLMNKYINNTDLESVLNIPIVGGLLYIWRKNSQASYWCRKLNRDYEASIQLKHNIKQGNIVRDSIRHQISEIGKTDSIKHFSVPDKYMFEFMQIKEEFPNITFLPDTSLGSNSFIMIMRDKDEVL